MRGFGERAGHATERVLDGMAGADFRARLGVSLTDALIELNARRAADPVAAVAVAPPLRARRRPVLDVAMRFRRPIAVGVALLTVGGAGAAASSLWLSPAGNPLYGFDPGLTATAPPAAQLSALAVLRRAQTAADRVPGVQAALTYVNNFTTGIRSNYVRVLESTAAGPVVLVPVEMRTALPVIHDALCVYYPTAASKQVDCWSTQQLLGGQAFAGLASHEYGLAPDSVAAADVSIGSWSSSAPLTSNFFDVQLPAGVRSGSLVPTAPAVTFSQR